MRWKLPLVAIATVIILLPLAAVVELPGERDVKDAIGIGQRSPCGPVINKGVAGTWRSEPPVPTLRDGPVGAVVGPHAYLVGGIASFNDDGTTADSLDTVERFDFRTGEYESLPPLPRELNHVAVAAVGGTVYAMGGLDDDFEELAATGESWRYVPDQRRWEEVAPLPTPRGAAGATVVDGKIYVVGGVANGDRKTTLEVYEPAEDRWEKLPPMEVPRDHLGVAALGGKIYAVGGRQSEEAAPLDDSEVYDVATGEWAKLSPTPEAKAGFGFEAIRGRLVAAGGENLGRRILSGAVWAYEPNADTWERLPDMTVPKHGFAMVRHDDRLWAFAGSRCSGFVPVRSVESYAPPRIGS